MITKHAEYIMSKEAFASNLLRMAGNGIRALGGTMTRALPKVAPAAGGVVNDTRFIPSLGRRLQSAGKATSTFAKNEIKPLETKLTNYAKTKYNDLTSKVYTPKSTGTATTNTAPGAAAATNTVNDATAAASQGADVASNKVTGALGKIPKFIGNNKLSLGIGAASTYGAYHAGLNRIQQPDQTQQQQYPYTY